MHQSLGASSKANYLLRALHPAATQEFASVHDNASRVCLSHLLDKALSDDRWDVASLPFYLDGLGLYNASRSRFAAQWSSWADCLELVKSRHPPIAAVILDALDNHHPGHHFTGARTAREYLLEARFDAPSWEALANNLRPDAEDSVSEPGVPRHGWQCKAMRPVNERFLEGVVQPRLLDASRALLRSQSGPFAILPFTSFPSARHARFDPQPFRVLLLRRLWLPVPLSSRSCRCGRPLDSSGHHRAACAVAGVLGSRGFALESAAARVCREAGGRVSANVRVQDMDLAAPNQLDNRRIEVVVNGLPLFHGAQLADIGLSIAPGWDPAPSMCQRGRCSPRHSKASQRDVP